MTATTATTTTTTRRATLVLAELGLLVLALGVAASFTRLFQGWGWLGRLALPVGAAWAVTVATRRAGLRVSWSVLVQAIAGLLVISWWFAPGTLALGLPTPTTWTVLSDEVATSFSSFSELIAPVPATDGFLVLLTVSLWVIASFADTAALRFRAPVQAAVPYVATFAAAGILARQSGRTVAALVFAVALALYAACQLSFAAAERRWVGGRAARGARAVFASTLVVGLLAVVGGALLGPRLPGDADPVVDLRELGKGNGPRTVVSPFVGIRSLLGDRSDQVMFTVRADQPAYWRLTALEQYDPTREIWISRGSYQRTDGALPDTMAPGIGGEPLRQQYRIEGLATLWLPAAYVPRAVVSDADLSYDSVSSSLILRDGDDAEPLTYELQSVLPDVAPLLAEGTSELVDEVDPDYLERATMPPEVTELVRGVTEAGADDYRKMLLLQDWFRQEFTYDDGVDFSDDDDALLAFLEARRGFCQQFSSAFALFARELGVPSRVAVGFTPGDQVEREGNGDDGTDFVVRGRHAHAWPEVYFDGIGWVPFEPTPQRGNPQAAAYTGVDAEQADPPPEQAATTTSTTTTAPTASTTPTSTPEELDATAEPPDAAEPAGSGGWLLGALFGVAALVVVGALVAAAARRRPGRGLDERATRDAEVAAAWADAVRALALIELRPTPSDTPLEFARRVDTELREEMLTPLARVETRRRFAMGAPSQQSCDDARRHASRVVDHVRAVTTRRQRVGGRLVR